LKKWWNQVPKYVKSAIETLNSNNFVVYIAGGAVRDFILKKTPKDIDLVTNATPTQIANLFSQTVSVGAKFGVMIVIIEKQQIEIATFRSDGAYTDKRRPDNVTFSSPQEDAQRRDFTMNGLFWDPNKKIILDYVNGQSDIKSKCIRTIGNAKKRFEEDALRILRCARFQAQLYDLNFKIENNTAQEATRLNHLITKISKERITEELFKILSSNNPAIGISVLANFKLLEFILPELNNFKKIDLSSKTIVLDNLKKSWKMVGANEKLPPPLVWAALSIIIKKTEPIVHQFIFSNSTKKSILSIIKIQKKLENIELSSVSEQKKIYGDKVFIPALALFCSVLLSKNKKVNIIKYCLSNFKKLNKSGKLNPLPLLKGRDLIALGFKPGPNIKKILDTVYELQLKESINSRIMALEYAKKLTRS